MLSFFPRGDLGEILNLIESVSEDFPSYSVKHTQTILGRLVLSVVVTSPKLTLMATIIGEVHSNFGSRNSVCRLLRIFIAQNINIAY